MPDFDASGNEILTRDDCYVYLRECAAENTGVGRVGMSSSAGPEIFPVNYALDGDDVVFKTHAGLLDAQGSAESVVAFEIDGVDSVEKRGWSVLLVGHAHQEADPETRARLSHLELKPWAPGTKTNWVRIKGEQVSGRRIPWPDA